MKKRLLKFSLIEGIIAAFCFIINYFFYHFVTDTGITTVFQSEPGKPFVALLIGIFATLHLFGSIAGIIAAYTIAKD